MFEFPPVAGEPQNSVHWKKRHIATFDPPSSSSCAQFFPPTTSSLFTTVYTSTSLCLGPSDSRQSLPPFVRRIIVHAGCVDVSLQRLETTKAEFNKLLHSLNTSGN